MRTGRCDVLAFVKLKPFVRLEEELTAVFTFLMVRYSGD